MRNMKQFSAATNGAAHGGMSIDDLLAAAGIVRALVRRAHALAETGSFPETAKAAAMLKKCFESELENNLIAAYDKLPIPQAVNGFNGACEQAE
jgi:hypothetical protein